MDEYGELHRATLDDVMPMINRAATPQERFIIAIQYLAGRRPGELIYLQKRHIQETDEFVRIRFFTEKIKANNSTNQNQYHPVDFNKATTPLLKYILDYANAFESPNHKLVNMSVRTIERIIDRTSEGKYNPYSFRHSRIISLMEDYVDLKNIKKFHNRASIRSLDSYVEKNRPVGKDLNIT